mmetsp:Transcript_13165/g.18631  ORF Transcript_13165/g.18631 Transcript_13165/m.18631 type:complete len:251 (-) Transcript_13165:52-804(-)
MTGLCLKVRFFLPTLLLISLLRSTTTVNAFVQQGRQPTQHKCHRSAKAAASCSLHMAGGGFGDFLRSVNQELDNFIDDAMDRKLGGGSTFYGERKSSFNGSGTKKKSYKATSQVEADKRDEARRHVFLDTESNKRRGGVLTGDELRDLIVHMWGQQYPVLIKRRRDALGEPRLYLVIHWKQLGKKNLRLTEEEYVLESDAVGELISDWGCANQVRNIILDSGHVKPKTMTQQYPGLFVPLDVDQDIVDTW